MAFVFNGHVLDTGAGRLVGVGDHGNRVYQILANYQFQPYGGGSFLRLIEFFSTRTGCRSAPTRRS